jgi:hypothetical protein
MLSDINTIIDEMARTSEFADGWKKIEITIGPNQIITLGWPAWKLKIVSFRVSNHDLSTIRDVRDLALNIEVLDNLYEDGDTFIWKTTRNPNERKWDDLTKAKVADVVDAFLDGAWTPPWKCGHCSSRLSGKYTPRW